MELYLRWLEKHETAARGGTPARAHPLRGQVGRADRAPPARPERHPRRGLHDGVAAEAAPEKKLHEAARRARAGLEGDAEP